MFYYYLYNLIIASDIDFPQLVQSDNTKADITISEASIPIQTKNPENKKYDFGENHSWLTNATCSLLIEYGRHIFYQIKPEGNPVYLRTYILGWGISMLALQRGEIAMHCSAVEKNGEAILICGESGCGKSTLTSAYLSNGYHLMADDMSVVRFDNSNVAYATSSFPYQKLCRDAAMRSGCSLDEMIYIDETKDKFLVPYKGEFPLKPIRISRLIVLGIHTGNDVISGKVTGLDKMHVCANNLFLRHLLKEKKYSPEIGSLCLKLAASVSIQYIYRPKDKNTANEVIFAADL